MFQTEYLYFQVIWLYNNQVVVPSKHLVITKDGNRHTLHIKDTKTTDFGQYTCYANNTEGSDKKNILLSGKQITVVNICDIQISLLSSVTWKYKMRLQSIVTSAIFNRLFYVNPHIRENKFFI